MTGTMHPMTQSAILNHRIVFPQERTAFFRMAGITIVVYRVLLQTGWPHSAMGVVAVAANQLVLADRVSRHLISLGPNILMAGITDFCLGGAFQHLTGFMHNMAGHAGQVLGLMRAGVPVQQMLVTLVAFQADTILGFQW